MNIGNVELPIVSEVEEQEGAEVDEVKDAFKSIGSTGVKHQTDVKSLIITGFVNQELHTNSLSIEEQKRKIKRLQYNFKLENNFVYGDYKGYLLVDSVDLSDTTESKIINEVEIESRYFPWPKYYPENEP